VNLNKCCGWSALLFAGAILSCFSPGAATAQDEGWRPPNAEAKIAALKAAGNALMPLFVLGDVNEDGSVDAQDRDLIRELVNSRDDSHLVAAVSCLAAADLNGDGAVDQRDLDLISGWVMKGKLVAPALSSQNYLPCDFRNFLLAASVNPNPGGSIIVRFIDDDMNTSNTALTVADGRAEVAASTDGRGYAVKIPLDANIGDLITLKIALPDAHLYLYTVTVETRPK